MLSSSAQPLAKTAFYKATLDAENNDETVGQSSLSTPYWQRLLLEDEETQVELLTSLVRIERELGSPFIFIAENEDEEAVEYYFDYQIEIQGALVSENANEFPATKMQVLNPFFKQKRVDKSNSFHA